MSISSRPVRLHSEKRSPWAACKDWREAREGAMDEWSTSIGWYTEGCVRPDGGRKARTVGHQWPPLSGLGELPPQVFSCRPESAVCVAVQRLVRTADPALQLRWQDVGAGG